MIIIKLQGGLGNQMFQYAIGRRMAEKNGTKLKLDIFQYTHPNVDSTPRNYSLDCFNVTENFANEKDNNGFVMYNISNISILSRIVRKLFNILQDKKPVRKRTYIAETGFDFQKEILENRNKNIYLYGNWQNENYFRDIAEIIRKDFTIKNETDNYKEITKQISNTLGAISLHIRRGDYVHNEKTNKYHGICSLDYYNKAIKVVAETVHNPTIFIFSDDIEWARENLKTKYNLIFISNDKLKDYEELILMSKCKYNIIANSSFSWWGAWLNQNPNKIVIAPKKWFADPQKTNNTPCPKNWIKI